MEHSTKGWSWGEVTASDSSLNFTISNQPCFSILYKQIANCVKPGRNELAIQFQQDVDMQNDVLCQMRLFIPDSDTCEAITKEIQQGADLKAYAGDAIVSLMDLPMAVPRGKYSIDMFQNFMRLHGKTHNYKVMYKNVSKAFLLPSPDQVHVALVIGLQNPIRQGNTLYPFVVINFQKEAEQAITLNMAPEEIKENYGEDLQQVVEGKTFDVVSRLLKSMAGVTIIIPGQFRSYNENHCIKCSVKANQGLLYPLQRSFIFINKPVTYIRFEDIRYIEFARVSQRPSNRSFDVHIYTKQGNYQFTGVDRHQHKPLRTFLEKKKIEIRTVQDEEDQSKIALIGQNMELDDEDDEDDVSFEASEDDNQREKY